ncbi:MAG: hypothetical protein ABIT20_16450 [Gemmatimonadaceae bacterium]
MIIGHIGVAFAATSRWRRVPLFALLVATFAPDIQRELLAALGLSLQQTNLYSHALPWSAALALGAGALTWAALRDRTSVLVVMAVVLSHVALDMISGSKPLWSNGPEGVNLGRVEQVELLVETTLLLVGWRLWRRDTKRGWMTHRWVPTLLVAIQAVVLIGSISQRPYATRCLASPLGTCTGDTWITTRWETTPFW